MTATRPAVVIPCLNRYDLSFDCVRSVRRTVPNAVVVIVDNGSSDRTALLDADVMVRNDENLGFSQGCNMGFEASNGCDPIVFLNSDTIVEAGWFEALNRALSLPRVAAATCRLVYPDRSLQQAGLVLLRPSDDELWVGRQVPERASGFVAAVAGACMAVRREPFAELGGFDPAFWNGYEDVDLCLRMWGAGYRVAYTAGGTVSHVMSASGPERFTREAENVALISQRWGTWSAPPELMTAGFPERCGSK